jgi:magnesium transporter
VEHASFLNSKAQFLLDAVLGVLNVEQNAIIKTFTVASVALMPPTLIASIYGMNFEFIPELKFTFGYPLALVLMIVSAILPILYFRRKGWL